MGSLEELKGFVTVLTKGLKAERSQAQGLKIKIQELGGKIKEKEKQIFMAQSIMDLLMMEVMLVQQEMLVDDPDYPFREPDDLIIKALWTQNRDYSRYYQIQQKEKEGVQKKIEEIEGNIRQIQEQTEGKQLEKIENCIKQSEERCRVVKYEIKEIESVIEEIKKENQKKKEEVQERKIQLDQTKVLLDLSKESFDDLENYVRQLEENLARHQKMASLRAQETLLVKHKLEEAQIHNKIYEIYDPALKEEGILQVVKSGTTFFLFIEFNSGSVESDLLNVQSVNLHPTEQDMFLVTLEGGCTEYSSGLSTQIVQYLRDAIRRALLYNSPK